jgi:hypothetical protein
MSDFQALNQEYMDLTGRDLFAYASQPDPKGPTKYVFQEEVITNKTAAIQYMKGKIAEARAHKAMQDQPHDYEPGETYHRMHTDPLCRICGLPKHA